MLALVGWFCNSMREFWIGDEPEEDLECGGGDGTDGLKSRVLARLGEVGL